MVQSQLQPRFLNETQLADLIGLSLKTLRNWRNMGKGPTFRKWEGGAVRYSSADVEKWIQRQPVGGAK